MLNKKNVAVSILTGLLVLVVCGGAGGCGSGSGATPGPTPTPTPAPNPTPAVTSISPISAPAGGSAFTLTVRGSNFVSASMVEWNGSSRTTTLVNSGEVQAHIMAADLATPGKVSVTVFNPAPAGGTSSAFTFTVAVNTMAFESARALDGSDAATTNLNFNIWVMNPDGTGATPLTRLTASSTDSTRPVWSPDGSKIAFDSLGALDGSDASNLTTNIWVMNADGSGRTPLTKLTHVSGITFGLAPAWSPDGSKIACQSLRALDGSDAASSNNVNNIWVINADGSGQTPLTKYTASGIAALAPAWSPDASKIAFQSQGALDGSDAANTNHTSNIWVMNSDGSGAAPLTRLTANFAGGFLPVWSPDGSKIAFSSTRALDGSDAAILSGTQNIWVVNADGSGATPLTKLTTIGADSFAPVVWSADSSKILFASQRALDGADFNNTAANVWVVNADGSGARPLTDITVPMPNGLGPVWSPDGSKVFFASARALNGSNATNTNNTMNIWVVNADGSGVTPLTAITALRADSRFQVQP